MGEILRYERKILHHIINVRDGNNFLNSKFPFWGVSENNRKYIETLINSGDILWFCKSFDDKFKRLWNYYLSFCSAGFRSSLDIGQFSLRKIK